MAHAVMCWELGGDLGHVARMRPLADALQARGHRVTFMVREPLAAGRLLDPQRYSWLQAPLQLDAVSPQIIPTRNFAAIMHNVGFHSREAILARMRAWRGTFAALKPDLLVLDHSPTALLAARGLDLRRILLGTGFGIPPQTEPLPPFDPKDSGPELAAAEKQVTEHINGVLRELGVERIGRLADLYHADASLLFTLQELDHYPQRQRGDYWGPPVQGGGMPPAWPAGSAKRVFAYLKPFKTLPPLLETFRQAGHGTLIYMSRHDGPLPAAESNLSWATAPVDLKQAAREADLVVCHSGHGTVSVTLLAGKPLLLLPLNIEQRMLAARVEAAGAGLSAPALAPEGMGRKFQRLLAEPAFTAAAGRFAERYAGLTVENNPERFAALAEKLLGSR